MPGALQGSIAIVWTSVFLYVQNFVDSVGYGKDITILKILIETPRKTKIKEKNSNIELNVKV